MRCAYLPKAYQRNYVFAELVDLLSRQLTFSTEVIQTIGIDTFSQDVLT